MKKCMLSLFLALALCTGFISPVAMATGVGDITDAQGPAGAEGQVRLLDAGSTQEARQTINFNYDWKFHLGDVSGAQKKDYDDKDWRSLTLPHDYSIEQDFTPEGGTDSGTGYLPGGTGWYRKTFVLPAAMAGKQISLNFGGVYMDSTTYVNGTMVGNYPYGYSPFAYDITKLLVCDGVTQNVVAVQTKNQLPTSRWYSGSGIYRNVDMVVTGPVHVKRYGTFVTTPDLKTEYGEDRAVVNVKTKVQNDSADNVDVFVKSTILNADGSVFKSAETTAVQTVAKGAVVTFEQDITTSKPLLWGVDAPNLYTMVTEVMVDAAIVDRFETIFGFRWTTFDPNEGFFLNGEYMKLNGVCMHHDQGALGSVANYRAIERQMEIMKDMGVNSIRVCHNPAADELLEICNRKGLLVIDEAFDCWEQGKRANDYGRFFTKPATHPDATAGQTWAEFDIKTMVERGKNDPCIIMWSIGNEILGSSGATARNLNKWVKEVDPTRKTFQGFNNFIDSSPGKWDVIEASDLLGFNYGEKNATYDKTHKETYPEMPIIGSETSSALRTRGYYANDDAKHIFTNYDTEKVGWGSTMEKSWQRNRDRKWLMGEYMWTGFDYIGEPSPYNNAWPSKSSYFGAVDTAGIPKDAFYMYQSVWTSVEDNPMVHLLPHWNWGGDAGYDIKNASGEVKVQAYTNAPSVELFLNNVSLGRKDFEQKETSDGRPYQEINNHIYAEWMVSYTPGELKAVSYAAATGVEGADKVIATDIIKTSGVPAQIRLTPDREIINADGLDLSYVLVEVLDADGNLVPTANNLVNFNVLGNGFIAGVDNGSQTAVDERYKDNKRKAFSGKAMLILQSTTEAGPISVTATSPGLNTAKITVFTTSDSSEKTLLGYRAIASIKTMVNTPPQLPGVTAIYSDGTTEAKTVDWDEIPVDGLARPGQLTVSGTVAGTSDRVSVLVTVAALIGARDTVLVTPVGTVPTLPGKVIAVYNTGETEEITVVWDRTLAAADVAQEGTVTVEGTAAGLVAKVKAIVHVKVAETIYVRDIARRDGTYPIPTASYVAGDPVEAINDGGVYYNSGPAGGRWIPWGHNQTPEWCQLELEAPRTIGKAGIDIWNQPTDTKMSLPDTLTVQTSDDGITWRDITSKTKSEIDLTDGIEDQKAMARVYFDFSNTPVTTKWVRWKFDNAAKLATGVSEVHVYEQETVLVADAEAKLSELKVGGVALDGFASDTLVYTVNLPFGAEVPEVTATAKGAGTVFIVPAMDANRATVITVTAEDGKTTNTYLVQFQTAAPVLETVELNVAGGVSLVEDDVKDLALTAKLQDGSTLAAGTFETLYTVGDKTVADIKEGKIYAYNEGSTTLKAAVTYQNVTVESKVLTLNIAKNDIAKTITGYEKVTVVTDKGIKPQLPASLIATFDSGLSKPVYVSWDAIDEEQYADYGTFIVEGNVAGQTLKPTATVLVKGIVGVQQFSTATPVRFPPSLPAKVLVYFSDGTTNELPVTWEPCTNEDFATDGATVTLTGEVGNVTRAAVNSLTTTMTVRVSGNTTVPVEPFTMYKNGYYLPLPFASYTNQGASGNGVAKIYDTVTTSNQISNSSDQNCWNNWTDKARPGDSVGIVFGFEEVTLRTVDNLNIYFYSDSGVAAPAKCEIQYYTGAPFVRNDVGQYPIDKLASNSLLANDENWTPVNILTEPEALTAHANNEFTFDAIQTCALRVKMTAQPNKSLGIIEMQAWDKLVSDVSDVAALTNLEVDGMIIPGFAADKLKYTYAVQENAELPTITATAGHNAAVTLVSGNSAKVIVTAENGVNTKTYTVDFTTTTPPAEKKSITAVAAVEPIAAAYGTNKTAVIAQLPTEVEVTFDDNTKANISATWDCPDYNANAAADYTFIGTLAENDEVYTNPTNITATCIVTVGEKPTAAPAAPAKPIVVAGDGTLTVSWTAPDDGGSEITGYVLKYQAAAGEEQTVELENVLTHELTELTNGTEYTISVAAVNSVGTGEHSPTETGTPSAETVDVESVTLTPDTLELTAGGSGTLTATVLPANASNKTVTWASNDETVATVVGGVVTAVGKGNAIITAVSTADPEKTATCTVTVMAEEPTPVLHTVTFDTKGGSAITPVTVADGASVARPAAPSKSGYTFAGWYRDEELAAVYDFNTAVTEDITIYAKWEEVPYVPPYTPPSNTTTETEKNEDGSTTKTVTNKKTGEVKATTTYPDGTKIVATTPKNGETTIEVTVPKGKDSVTVIIPTDRQPAPGEVAVIAHEDGTREIIKLSVSTKDGMRVSLEESCKLEIMDNSKSFVDVPADHWGADAIAFVTSRELFNGTSGGFDPAGEMSRAMLFTVLARLDGQDTTGGDTWYEKSMDWAKEAGVSDGTNPEASITRESLAVMLYRYAGSPDVGGMALGEFSDVGDISDWAIDAMLWCTGNGIIGGKNGDLLDPAGTASRAEVATMLQRYIENLK